MTSTLRRRIIVTVATLALCMPAVAFAADPQVPAGGGGGTVGSLLGAGLDAAAPPELKGSQTSLPDLAGGVIKQLLRLTGVVLLGYLLYGGFKYMTSGGDQKGAEAGMMIIRHAIIGLVIIAASYAIALFVVSSISNAATK